MQLENYKITKYTVGRLDEVIVNDDIKQGIIVLIPLNMEILKMNGILDDYFDLNKKLYFCVNILRDELLDSPLLSIVEYENKKLFKQVEFMPNEYQEKTIYTYAMEGLVYLSQKGIVYKPYHKMK